jgi:hypothetical protein
MFYLPHDLLHCSRELYINTSNFCNAPDKFAVPSLNGNDCAPNIYTQNSNESKNRTYKYGITFISYRYLNFVYVDIRCGQHNHDR